MIYTVVAVEILSIVATHLKLNMNLNYDEI